MVLEGEVAHETKGAQSNGDARWHLSRVEIPGRIKQRAVATKRDNVVDLVLVSGRENCSDLLFQLAAGLRADVVVCAADQVLG